VPDWTEAELTALLVDRGVQAAAPSANVFGTLRNPRILSMALELLDAKDIERIEEFSVGRLLFEHMRRSDYAKSVAVPAHEFARALREIAAEFINRLKSREQDDLKLFNAADNATLAAVASSRYFASVGNDPDLYSRVAK
jgi:sulfur transfer complex TusBCD TusB component (DsrH family)